MKKDTGASAASTNDKGFGGGSKKGITPSTAHGVTPKTKGNKASFKAGKKTVGK